MSGFFFIILVHLHLPFLHCIINYHLKEKKTKKKKVCKPLSCSLMDFVLYSIPMIEDPSLV